MAQFWLPQDGSWKKAPDEMPEDGEFVLFLHPKIPYPVPVVGRVTLEYGGWVYTEIDSEWIMRQSLIQTLDESVWWSSLPQWKEIRVSEDDDGST